MKKYRSDQLHFDVPTGTLQNLKIEFLKILGSKILQKIAPIPLLLFLVPAFFFGQSGQSEDAPFRVTIKDIDKIEREYVVVGNPYLDQDFKLGYWYLNGRRQKELAMRYDAYHDLVQLLQDDQKVYMAKSSDIEARFDGKTYRYIDYLDHGNEKVGYFIPLNEGKTLLYLKFSKTIRGPIKPENGYALFKPAEFQTTTSYYIKPEGKPAMPLLGLSRKEVFAVLWDKYSELRSYARSHKLRVRDEKDAVAILAYYDQLKSDDDKNIGPTEKD